MLLLLFVGAPTVIAWAARVRLAAALSDAESITLEQFTLFRHQVVASKRIPPSDSKQVLHAFPFSIDYGVIFLTKMCFIPHHRIVIKTRQGDTFTCLICFQCDQYSLNSKSDSSIHDMPLFWSGRLRQLFMDAGIPTNAPKESLP